MAAAGACGAAGRGDWACARAMGARARDPAMAVVGGRRDEERGVDRCDGDDDQATVTRWYGDGWMDRVVR